MISFALTLIAAQLQDPVCNFPGCGLPPADLINNVAIPEIARIALNATAALAVIFGIVGGARYLLSAGREEETEKGRQTIQWALLGILVALASHRFVTAVLSEDYTGAGDPLFGFFTAVVYMMTALLNVGFFLMIIWGGALMVMAQGKEDEVSKGRKSIIYAIAGAVIINVIPYAVKAMTLIIP